MCIRDRGGKDTDGEGGGEKRQGEQEQDASSGKADEGSEEKDEDSWGKGDGEKTFMQCCFCCCYCRLLHRVQVVSCRCFKGIKNTWQGRS